MTPHRVHIEALELLYKHLRGDLMLTHWPPPPYVMTPPLHDWPPIGAVGMERMYIQWWALVREGFKTARARGWLHVKAYDVAPLRAPPVLVIVLRRLWPACWGKCRGSPMCYNRISIFPNVNWVELLIYGREQSVPEAR